MLVKITKRCASRCVHCMESSLPDSPIMSMDVFERALSFTLRVERHARDRGYRAMLFSGGECTEHPDILSYMDLATSAGFRVVVLSNGMFLWNKELAAQVIERAALVQVTFDPRFYRTEPPPAYDHPKVVRVDRVGDLFTIGRWAKGGQSEAVDAPQSRTAPTSFNFRSLVHKTRSVPLAVASLRVLAMQGRGWGNCSPSISHDGTFVAGESSLCAKIGTVDSSDEELLQNVLNMGSCDRCHLESKLGPEHRRAIGLNPVVIPNDR